MSIETLISKNGEAHQLAVDIDRVTSALEYAESDPEATYKPTSVTKIYISQLKKNLSTLNSEIG